MYVRYVCTVQFNWLAKSGLRIRNGVVTNILPSSTLCFVNGASEDSEIGDLLQTELPLGSGEIETSLRSLINAQCRKNYIFRARDQKAGGMPAIHIFRKICKTYEGCPECLN